MTGTPIGAQLSDLYGQIRFLRIAPFDRAAFWKNNVEDPFYEHSIASLTVLRKLLSRFIIRHEKSQTVANGESLLSLPPRTIETTFLQWGSKEEKTFYDCIDAHNRAYVQSLQRESRAKITSKYFQLNGILYRARQACAHPSIVDMDKLQRFLLIEGGRSKARCQLGGNRSTRDDILASAVKQARFSCQNRMREVVAKFQKDDACLECSICFEVVGEKDIAIPAW